MNQKLTTGVSQLHPMAVVSSWYCIGMGFIGPIFPTADDGSKYIFTISDYFSKYVEAIHTPDKCSSRVASLLYKVLMVSWHVYI